MRNSRPRAMAFLAALAVAPLASCAGGADSPSTTPVTTTAPSPDPTPTPSGSAPGATTGAFTAGRYDARGLYPTPGGVQEIAVEVEIDANGTITDVEVEPQAKAGNSVQFQGEFARGVRAQVVGRPITELDVTRVSGSSLTSTGFNTAIDKIIQEATR